MLRLKKAKAEEAEKKLNEDKDNSIPSNSEKEEKNTQEIISNEDSKETPGLRLLGIGGKSTTNGVAVNQKRNASEIRIQKGKMLYLFL
jgi:hypothetical protein